MKLAILSTSQCRKDIWDRKTDTVVATQASEKLVKLVESGYTVIVVSSRKQAHPLDECWQKLVDEDKVYFAGVDTVFGACGPEVIEMWRVLFDRFGIEKPEDQTTWVSFRHAAAEQDIYVGFHDQEIK